MQVLPQGLLKMNEVEWGALKHPTSKLKAVREMISPRKERLFAVACSASVWGLMTDSRSRQAIEIAERFADGKATVQELTAAHESALEAARDAEECLLTNAAEVAAAASAPGECHVLLACDCAQMAVGGVAHRAQLRLVEEIIGHPFREIVLDAAVMARNDGLVTKLARSIYEEGAFNRMPVLGRALAEAGCEREEVLRHCGVRAAHVRGCWVLDLILGNP